MTTTNTGVARSVRLEKSSKYYPIRRSTRLPLEIPLHVTSLDPTVEFAENCTTVTVNAHGCGLISPRRLDPGSHVNLQITSEKQSTSARVLELVPLNDDNTSWLLGMELEKPGNFWGIKYAPTDWSEEGGEAQPAPASTVGAPSKQIPVPLLRRLLSECRLGAISVGACYVQTGTTFPLHAPVKVSILAGDSEHSLRGTVRVEHVGAGMGIEFTGRGEEHVKRIAALIQALNASEGKIPDVRVELAAPDKNNPPEQSKGAHSSAAQYDSLLGLILVGGALKRSDFLRELEKQRRRG